MSNPTSPHTPPPPAPQPDDRLGSWKEIAAYLGRDVTTAQRWEKREAMPVHRHQHDKLGSVYAYRSELDAWMRTRRVGLEGDAEPAAPVEPVEAGRTRVAAPVSRTLRLIAAGAVVAAAALAAWVLLPRERAPGNPLATARFTRLTDFDGIEQAAALSRDGRFVAFLSDRDGPMDVWLTQLGSGEFHNLTRGGVRDLVNPAVRTIGFSPDGTLVTFWVRRPDAGSQAGIGIWAVPVLGGSPRPYLEGAAELDWSPDAARLVYHTPGPGDPTFVREAADPASARELLVAPAGLHTHYPVWSPDGAFVYFVQGAIPDRLDVWRIPSAGGTPARVTSHDARVSHPVFLDARTLLYLATDVAGDGPWIYAVDPDRPAPARASAGVDRYASLAGSADGRRLVATLASPKRTLWRVPVSDGRADMASAARVPLTTIGAVSPRLGPDFLLYVSPKGSGDSLWKLQAGAATELWSTADGRVVAAPAIARDGRRIAFVAAQSGATRLYVMNADGTDARLVPTPFNVRGGAEWAPDGASLTVSALADGTPRLFTVPLDGGPPSPLVGEFSVDPVWLPAGDALVFSGPDIGTTFEVKGVKADGTPLGAPPLRLGRGARHRAFASGPRSVVVLRGESGQRSLWRVDLDTGAERQLTAFAPGFDVRDFDVSPDGREIVVEQVQEHSDLVLIDLPGR